MTRSQFLTLLFCLFALVCFVTASPSPCSATINVLDIQADEAEIDEEKILSTDKECDPASTCQMNCSCGKILYFDMTKYSDWTHSRSQAVWRSVCGTKRESVTHYVSSEIYAAAGRLVKKKGGLFGSILNMVQKVLMASKIRTVLGGVFKTVYTRYVQICHGGKELSSTHLTILTTIFRLQLSLRAHEFKQYPNYSNMKKEAEGIFHRFIAKIRAGGFKYCDCVPVLRKYSLVKYLGAHLACTRACSRNLLEVAADEYLDE